MEEQCEIVSERGYESFIEFKILCEKDIYQVSQGVKDGDIIFCKTDFIPFLSKNLHLFNVNFNLVSGRSDYTIPHFFQSFSNILLESPKVKKWYAVNCVEHHEKFVPIPLGIDFHTMYGDIKKFPKEQEDELFLVKREFKPLSETNANAITNFHHAMENPPLRRMIRSIVYNSLYKKDCVIWLPKQDRIDFWRSCNDDMFVICPFGNGPDTHRTYEVLALGRVPIISKCYFNDVLFSDLPVVIIESWNCITKEFLVKQREEILKKFEKNEYNFEKITSLYWQRKIKQG